MGAFAVKESVVSWPGDLGDRPGLAVVLGFLAAAGFRATARPRVKLERPQPLAPVRARARTN